MTNAIITEIPKEEIEQLRQDVSEAIAMIKNPDDPDVIRAAQVREARKIISEFPTNIRYQSANNGAAQRGFVAVMSLRAENFKPLEVEVEDPPRTAENLIGVAAIVHKACLDAGLESYVGSWYNMGIFLGLCVPINENGYEHAKKMKERYAQ